MSTSMDIGMHVNKTTPIAVRDYDWFKTLEIGELGEARVSLYIDVADAWRIIDALTEAWPERPVVEAAPAAESEPEEASF